MSGVSLDIDLRPLLAVATKLHGAKKGFPAAINRAVTNAGNQAVKEMQTVLVPQTGLTKRTMVKAIKGKKGGARFTIASKGGDVRLKFFKPRETASGVTAAPWSKRRLYNSTFIRSGWWPKRGKPVAGGNVMQRVGGSKYPIRTVRSGLFIPEEMVSGASQAAFYGVADRVIPIELERALHAAFG